MFMPSGFHIKMQMQLANMCFSSTNVFVELPTKALSQIILREVYGYMGIGIWVIVFFLRFPIINRKKEN